MQRAPATLESWARGRFANPDYRDLASAGKERRADPYCDAFFAGDRLVCDRKRRAEFPGLELTTLASARPLIVEYHRFRFSDTLVQ